MTARCCVVCGRWGTHQFRPSDSPELEAAGLPEGWVCTNDRACAARRTAADVDALGSARPVFWRAGKTTWQVVGPPDLDAGMWVEVARRDGSTVVAFLDKVRDRYPDGRVVARTSGTKKPRVGDTYRDLDGTKFAVDAVLVAAIEAHRAARDVCDVQPFAELSRREVRELAARLPFLGEFVAYADEQEGTEGEDGRSFVGMPLDVLQELKSALGQTQPGAASARSATARGQVAAGTDVIAVTPGAAS